MDLAYNRRCPAWGNLTWPKVREFNLANGEIEIALGIDANLHTARLQLALLYFGASKGDKATSTLEPLVALPETDPLRQFGEGLMDLARDALPEAKAKLTVGISLNRANPALNADMQRIIDEIDKTAGLKHASTQVDEELPTDPSARHIFLSAYGHV